MSRDWTVPATVSRKTTATLRKELDAACRQLDEAYARAHKDAWRCDICHAPHTANVRFSQGEVLHLAQELGSRLRRSRP